MVAGRGFLVVALLGSSLFIFGIEGLEAYAQPPLGVAPFVGINGESVSMQSSSGNSAG
jgi:hypothetical protein